MATFKTIINKPLNNDVALLTDEWIILDDDDFMITNQKQDDAFALQSFLLEIF